MKLRTLLLVLLVSSTAFAADGAAKKSAKWKYDLSHGTGMVMFDATGRPSMLKIHGKGNNPEGELLVLDGKVNGAASFDMTTLDTGIAMRNNHMKDKYLEVGNFPKSKLTITEMKLPDDASKSDFTMDNIPFKGMLALHGVEKPVEGTCKLSRKGDNVATEAVFEMKVSDFGITSPTFAGVTMTDTVKVTIQTNAPFTQAE